MKKRIFKVMTFIFIFLLLLPMISFRNSDAASKRPTWSHNEEPELSATNKTLTGRNKTFELSIRNLSTYAKSIKWYSTNKKAATVKASDNGRTATVTSVGPGTANISCSITFAYKKTVNLYCKITVKAAAERIEITNAREDRDLRHVIELGEEYDFNSKITPENSLEKTYWFIDNESYATVNSQGVVTAKKVGIVTLTAVAAQNEKDAALSSIRNQILIEIVDYDNDDDDDDCNGEYEPQAKLLSLVRTDKSRLTATFDRAIQTPGLILVNNNTECIEGKVDSGDSKKVNYTLSGTSSKLSGWMEVSIGYWEGYQVSPADNTADKLMKMGVDFTINSVNPLPAPVSITQSPADNNAVILKFNNRLDKASAENKANYSIAGVTVLSAELTNGTGSAVVKLTLKQGSIPTDGNYLSVISGIKGYENSYTVMNAYYGSVYLKENMAPVVNGFSYTYPVTISITFNEPLQGYSAFQVLQNNKDYASYSYIDNNRIIIILNETPEMNKTLRVISTVENAVTDLSGNKVNSLTRNLTPTN